MLTIEAVKRFLKKQKEGTSFSVTMRDGCLPSHVKPVIPGAVEIYEGCLHVIPIVRFDEKTGIPVVNSYAGMLIAIQDVLFIKVMSVEELASMREGFNDMQTAEKYVATYEEMPDGSVRKVETDKNKLN